MELVYVKVLRRHLKYLCDKVGLPAGVVVGKANGEDMLHAWNQICINDRWYNIDVTFDANLSKAAGDVRYDYFNVSDAEMKDRSSLFSGHICKDYYGFYIKREKICKMSKRLKIYYK